MFLGVKTLGSSQLGEINAKKPPFEWFFCAFKKFWFVQIPVIGKGFVVICL